MNIEELSGRKNSKIFNAHRMNRERIYTENLIWIPQKPYLQLKRKRHITKRINPKAK